MLRLFLAFGCANDWNALDADGDGWTIAAGDCWDQTTLHGGLEGSEIHPGAPDVPYDGVDADCAGDDDFDHDGDGYVTSIWANPVTEGVPSSLPGGDCWDDRDQIEQEFGALPGFPQLTAADVHPGASDTWYDGVDANCDGGDDFDQDADGHPSAFHRDGASTLGDDCYDAEGDPFENPASLAPADVHPGATDTCYDATDADCDGKSDWDCDGDGFLKDADCDDDSADVHPGAVEKWYDGIDQDCDGDDADKDHDGFLALDYKGTVKAPGIEEGDCWDDPDIVVDSKNGLPPLTAKDVHPFAIETWYDGINQDCDEVQDFDQDHDGYDAAGMDGSAGSPDCVDTDAAIHPDQDESCTTSYDDNCDGDNNDASPPYCTDHFYDGDDDDHGDAGIPAQCTCGFWPWDVTVNDDCDDANPAAYQGADELVGDQIDEDCDGGEICYADEDGDSYRDDTTKTSSDSDCTDPGEAASTVAADDCDDTLDTVNPGEKEICDNGLDDNCDQSTDPCAATGSYAIDTVANASLVGETGDGFGYAIATGDLSGDGTTDVVISANLASTVYGFLGAFSARDIDPSSREFQIESSESGFAESLAASADLNGDGVNDVALGNPFSDIGTTNAGAAFVFFGALSGDYTDAETDANVVFVGDGNDDQLGVSLATGDWDGDGADDLAIGANTQDTGATHAGALWIFFGPLSGTDSFKEPDVLQHGVRTDDHASRSLARGDVDGDGVDDIAVGVPGLDLGATNAGGAYVVLGPVSGDTDLESSATYELYADDGNGDAGTSLAVADFDGSGADDVVVGAPDSGIAYLASDDQLASSPIFDLVDAIGTVDGIVTTSALAGPTVGSAGDFDNDGRADLFVGASGDEQLAIFYSPPFGSVDITAGDLLLTGSDGFGYAAQSLGDSGGPDDLIIGAPADATTTGTAWILFGAGM